MLTDNTRILMSFGAVDGGFEFAMQLRHDIYRKFGRNPDSDPAFCYIDAESLRPDSKTKYDYDVRTDKNMMSNPDWDRYYEAAMVNCKTIVLLITKLWLTSKWCWREMDMLVRVAEKKPTMKVVIAWWPDAMALMQTDTWMERQEGGVSRTPRDLWARFNALQNRQFYYHVSGSAPIIGLLDSGGSNTFAYACTETESQLLIAQIEG